MTDEIKKLSEFDSASSIADTDIFVVSQDLATIPVTRKSAWSLIKSSIGDALGAIITAITSKSTLVDDDVFIIGDSEDGDASKSVTYADLKASIESGLGASGGGWSTDSNTWSYSSVDSPTGVISVNADMTAVLQKGMRVSYEQSQALSAYWTFNTNSTADVGSFTMADIGTPTYTSGKFSNALTLDGSTDGLSITDTATLKPTGDFTIGAWVKSSDSVNTQTIFASYSQNTNVAGLHLGIDSGGYLRVLIGKNTGATLGVDYLLITNTSISITDGNWHYVVMTYRNNLLQIYLDGNLIVSGYTFAPAYGSTNYVRVGCQSNTGTNQFWFNGQIDDLFVINGYALDEETIRAKYRQNTAQGTGSITLSKKAIVTNVGDYSGGNTLITLYHGTDHLLANATISNPRYSNMKVPFGFNSSPDKWTKIIFKDVTDPTQSSPVAATWYNLGSVSGSVPIGLWNVSYTLAAYASCSSAGTVQVSTTLSTSSSAESNSSYTLENSVTNTTGTNMTLQLMPKVLSLPSKTTFYILTRARNNTYTSLYNFGASSTPTTAYAICAYL